MAAKKKAKPEKEPTEDIPSELAEEIQDAVSMEDKPSKQARSTRIAITHYEDDKKEEAIDVTEAPKSEESSIAADEPAEPEDNEPKNQADSDTDTATIETEEQTQSLDEEDTEEAVSDDHEWHLIEEENTSETESESSELSEVTDNSAEGPEWDEEKWHQANADDDKESDRPEWDEEKWHQANIDEEEAERPDWDEEKWQQANADKTSESLAEEEQNSANALDDKVEAEISDDATNDAEDVTNGKMAAEHSVSEAEADEPLSAGQIAINEDDETEAVAGAGIRDLPKRLITWWKRANLRNSALATLVILLIVFITLPAPRYAVLNSVGVRATASISVLDQETTLPLRDVSVSIAGQTVSTNQNGLATFDDVRLGSQQIKVTKSAYEEYAQNVTIGVGSNTIQPISLVAIGNSFEFQITDWLTGNPIEGSEVSYEENSAYANSEGIAKLNTPTLDESKITVVAIAPGYATQSVEVDTTSEQLNQVDLVLSRHHLFVSKRDGNYGVYKIRGDGSDEQLVLAGTGNEGSELRFGTSPSGEKSVLVAVRDKDETNDEGFVLSGLYVIDVESGDFEKFDSSERIDIVGWIGDRVIYVKVQAGASGRNPQRHRLISLDTRSGELNQIAASNFFNDVLVAGEYVFYAPSDQYKQNPKPYLFRSDATGTTIETVFEKTVWTILRTGVDKIKFDANQDWYEGKISQIINVETDKPNSFTSRLYTVDPSGKKAAWVDIRDGKGTLIVEDIASGEETTVISQGGLRNPIVWLSDQHLIYRVVTPTETADYLINLSGDKSLKISDVTDISGADRWYYFY